MKLFKINFQDGGEGLLPLRFVWGIKPVDNGNYLDPTSRGELEFDETFDISDQKSQVWLRKFCHNLRAQPFYHDTQGPLLSNCFIESFSTWMTRRCEDPGDPQLSRAPCCDVNSYPYKPHVLRRCVAEASADLYRTPHHLWTREGAVAGGIKYLKDSVKPAYLFNNNSNNNYNKNMPVPKIMVLIVEYDSTYSYSLSFAEMNEFYNKVETWMQQQLSTAPRGMKNGWFVSYLEFYELQRTLYEGTIWAMVVSMILALIVLALVTLNPLVSLYAILAIGGAILSTVAALILLGWRLNVLESVTVSTAIGLAVDFSLHYSVSYRACKSEKRLDRVKRVLEQMGGPTLMAAATSGVSGALMLPSHVLAYIQIAIFLLLIMGVSWLYATFFLCPLLAVVGPSPEFAQFHYTRLRRLLPGFCGEDEQERKEDTSDSAGNSCRSGKGDWRRKNKSGCMLSESNLSTSSTVCQLHCPEVEIRLHGSESLPSPSSPLLYLDPNQTDSINVNVRRK